MGIGKLKTVGDLIRIDYGCQRKEKEWRTRFCGGNENEGKKLFKMSDIVFFRKSFKHLNFGTNLVLKFLILAPVL